MTLTRPAPSPTAASLEMLDGPARLLAMASEMAGLGAWSLRLPDGQVSWSTQAEKLLGQSGLAPTLDAALARLPADARETLRLAVAACVAHGTTVERELRVHTAAQPLRWLRLRAEAVRDADGQVVGLQGVFQDISATKLAEQVLRESEARFRALVEGLEQVSVQGYDSQRRVIFWNGASERLYGYTREEALGRQLEDLIIPPEMRDAVIEGTRQWLASGVVSVPAEELVLRHKNGSPVPVFSSHTMQRSLQGEPVLYCVDVDLSERAAAEAARRRLEERLRDAEKLEALGTMAGGIAHDFNNVLGAVLANATLIRESLPAGHSALANLELIARSGRRARSMVQQILSFSRRQVQSLQVVDVVHEARSTLGLLQASLRAGVQLRLHAPPTALNVMADTAQLHQVLMNLCSNALQSLPESGGLVEVGVEATALYPSGEVASMDPTEQAELADLSPGDYVCLSVADSGCGMDAATRARVFEPFFTTKAHGQGTGLGLSVVHGIVLAHGGAITLRSEPGVGTTFKLYWPSASQVSMSDATSEWGDLGDTVSPGASPLGIVYVDDDEVMRLTVQALLERAGYRVWSCASTAQAQRSLLAHADEVGLLVTDFNMPDGDGLSLVRRLRNQGWDLPVVLSSGYVTDAMLSEAARLGGCRVLNKERLHEDLLNHIRSLLQAP